MADEEIAAEEIERRAREYVFRRRRPIGHTTRGTSLYAGDFYDTLREFLQEPLLQDLAELLQTGVTDRTVRRRRVRLLRFVIQVSDLLFASAQHGYKGEWKALDFELAGIVAGALNPDEQGHAAAMLLFEDWEQRKQAQALEEARQYAPAWIRQRRRRSS
ncbi:MAG: hypothetical protein GEU75_10440 [Dehalococcoidia bacterium]|nr:hypothetical protein [Dehalococcoidia bacterium]